MVLPFNDFKFSKTELFYKEISGKVQYQLITYNITRVMVILTEYNKYYLRITPMFDKI